MRTYAFLLAIAALSVSCLPVCAQDAGLAGNWKADLAASKIAGPPLKDYVEIIDQTGTRITETIGQAGVRGEDRSDLWFATDGTPAIRPYRGVPSRETALKDEAGLLLTIETAGRPETIKRRYQKSSDGETLTITTDGSMNGHEMHNVVVLKKADEAAVAWLRKPEAAAADHMKNLKTSLKDLPTSRFIDRMRYFAWALNKDCEFCHVQGHFDSDDKKEKRTARQMIDLVSTVNRNYFEGKNELKCFTCHEFHGRPLSRPRFEGEPEHREGEAAAKP